MQIVHPHRSVVGESPLWCDRTQCLWWVDIRGPSIQRLTIGSGAFRRWRLDEPVGCIALTEGAHLVVGLKSGFALFDPADGTVAPLAAPEAARPGNRLNDGAVSRGGRFFAASVAGPPDRPFGALHRLDLHGGQRAVATLVTGLHVGNGLAFSPDDRTCYLSDSWVDVATIWRFDHDPATGRLSDRRMFCRLPPDMGRPDGGAVDAEGGYWSAAVEGGQLIRFTPDGTIDRCIPLPVRRPSKAAFGGDDLRTLYVTSIYDGDDGWSGRVLAFDAGIRGLPEPRVPLSQSSIGGTQA